MGTSTNIPELPDRLRTFHGRLLDAAGVREASLSPSARRTLAWLAAWDEPTIAGLEDLLRAARGTPAPRRPPRFPLPSGARAAARSSRWMPSGETGPGQMGGPPTARRPAVTWSSLRNPGRCCQRSPCWGRFGTPLACAVIVDREPEK